MERVAPPSPGRPPGDGATGVCSGGDGDVASGATGTTGTSCWSPVSETVVSSVGDSSGASGSGASATASGGGPTLGNVAVGRSGLRATTSGEGRSGDRATTGASARPVRVVATGGGTGSDPATTASDWTDGSAASAWSRVVVVCSATSGTSTGRDVANVIAWRGPPTGADGNEMGARCAVAATRPCGALGVS